METLLSILESLHPEVDFETADRLIEDGILDSFDIVTLVSELDDRFGVQITAEDLIPENFNSAGAMERMLQRLGKG